MIFMPSEARLKIFFEKFITRDLKIAPKKVHLMGKALKRRTRRTFCPKRRKKGGIPEKGGKRRNLTPW